MEVQSVNMAEPKRQPKRASILLTAAAGGGLGYGLKRFLPVGEEELAQVKGIGYKDELLKLNEKAQNQEIRDLRKHFRKNPFENSKKAFDTFRKMQSTDTVVKANGENIYNKGTESLKKAVDAIKAQVKAAGAKVEAKQLSDYIKEARMKRPGYVYAVPGIILGVVGAFVYNVIGKFRD